MHPGVLLTMERPQTPEKAYGQQQYTASLTPQLPQSAGLTPQLPRRYGYPPQAYSAPAPAPYGFAPPVLTPLPNQRRRRPRRRRQRSPNSRSGSSTEPSRSASPVEAPPPPPLSPSTDASNKILTRTTSATTACLNDYEAQWIAMATTRKMSVDNAEGLLEAVRSHTTKRHEGVVRWYTEKNTTASSRRPGPPRPTSLSTRRR